MKTVPWRMILVLLLLVIVVVFAGFNLEGVTVSVGFHEFEDVPLFLAMVGAFVLGALIMVPFTLTRPRQPKLNRRAEPEDRGNQEREPSNREADEH